MTQSPIAIAVHGGAGVLTKELLSSEVERDRRADLETALRAGHAVLSQGGDSLEAVARAVALLEDSPAFNAGKGSVLTSEGSIEMEASIMEGASRRAGAATRLTRVRNPIQLARTILEHSPHVMLSGAHAEVFARRHGVPFEDPQYFLTEHRKAQLARALASGVTTEDLSGSSEGTVGAVAIDRNGHLAAATSTGGMTGKVPGRIGDSPLIGAGTYADDRSVAVSTTGHGEFFIRAAAAHDVSARVLHGGRTLEQAARGVIDEVSALGGSGGLIAIDRAANVVFAMSSTGMFRGAIDAQGRLNTFILADEP